MDFCTLLFQEYQLLSRDLRRSLVEYPARIFLDHAANSVTTLRCTSLIPKYISTDNLLYLIILLTLRLHHARVHSTVLY